MVIQRIQSLFLLIASVLMALVSFIVPIAQVIDENDAPVRYYIYDMPSLMVINILVAILLFVAIFLYKNLPFQMKVTRISIVLTFVSVAFLAYIFFTIDGKAMFAGSTVMLIVALVCEFMALYGMNKDYKLLRSYDRLR